MAFLLPIIGETNAGKSTLLNALVGEDRAIVSDIHGTTRDVIEDTMNIRCITFRFIDTAGIRQTSDTIEAMGIERSFKALDQAQIVILMYDLTRSLNDFRTFTKKCARILHTSRLVLAMNKCDAAGCLSTVCLTSSIASQRHFYPHSLRQAGYAP